VRVVAHVAIGAARPGDLKTLVDVASFARLNTMLSDQREIRQVVVKPHIGDPAVR